MPMTLSGSAVPKGTPAAPIRAGSGSDPMPAQPSPVPTALLRRFIQAYWLRPENALWMTLRSLTLSREAMKHPSVDMSCGDGIFSFLHMGGELDAQFDVFRSVTPLSAKGPRPADMFDHVKADYAPPVTRPPVSKIDVGEDCKESMLAKAATLNFYEKLVRHDNNTPLPFRDAEFQTVYCNSAYWVDRIDAFLAELRRVTRPGGRVILQVKLESMKRFTLEAHRGLLGDRFLEVIGSRFESWPTLADRATWERRFTSAGWTIESATPFVTGAHARLWDVGLRPLAPLLIRMADGLDPANRKSIKTDWVNLMLDILEPLCDPALAFGPADREPVEMQYVLTPSR